MKLTKSKLKQIIKEEVKDIESIYGAPGAVATQFTEYELDDMNTDQQMIMLLKEILFQLKTLNHHTTHAKDSLPPTSELGDVAEGIKEGMLDQPNFKSKVAWVKRNKPGVKDPDAYVASALRSAGEIE